MTYVVWSKDLSVGIGVIDKQHMRIVNYVNELHDAINLPRDTRSHAGIITVVGDVIEYTESHFGFEEAMLEDAGYPFLKAHKKVHELFIRKMLDYKHRLDAGEDIAVELRETLTRWLINHIKNEDTDYSRWVNKSDSQATPESAKAKAQVHEEGWLRSRLTRFFGS